MLKSKNNYLELKKFKILKSIKSIIKTESINNKSLDTILKEININNSEIYLAFPNSSDDLIKFALNELNKDLEKYCKKFDLIRLPLHKRIRKIILSKFFIMNKEKIFYKKLYLNVLIPNKNFSLTKQLYNSIDQIWHIAGDNSSDFSFYTKRLILTGIYLRAILFFFNNNDQEALEQVLDNDLQRVSKIPALKSKMKLFKNNFPSIIKFVKNFN